MSELLSVEGLRLGYGRADVVHGIGLAVRRGSIVSLIGSNGAGKTTILRSLSGLMKPRAGRVLFGDGSRVDIAGEAAHRIARRGIVQVPEGRQVFANMTVAENLRLGAYHVPGPEAARRQQAVEARFPRLAERLRQRVTTRHLNLAAPYLGLGTFDVIWLRNVLIYFDAETKADILRRMLPILAPDGFLLLGSSETTLDLPADLAAAWRREQIGRVPAYQRAGAPAPAPATTPAMTLTRTGA